MKMQIFYAIKFVEMVFNYSQKSFEVEHFSRGKLFFVGGRSVGIHRNDATPEAEQTNAE